MPAVGWAQAPGPPRLRPPSAGLCHGGWQNRPQGSRISGGRPSSGCVNAPGDSPPEGNTPTGGRWLGPGHSRACCGRWPNRCRSGRQSAGPSATGPSPPKVCQRASAETQPRDGVTRGGVERRGAGYACRERGRHPTDARKVVPNPRRAAGSTVVYDWRRLCRCPEVNKHHADLKNPLPTLDIGSHSNARHQARRTAGAQRTLFTVACMPGVRLGCSIAFYSRPAARASQAGPVQSNGICLLDLVAQFHWNP